MGDKIHHYKIKTVWSGKSIVGNADVKSYDRSHRVLNEGKLHPTIIVKEETMIQKAIDLHHEAHKICHIANSVNFEITVHPVVPVKN